MAAALKPVLIIGAGLAGCEAAWQLAARGVPVKLYEMKPAQMTPAHHLPSLAELVCSNSLRSARLVNAVGLLKEEMRRLGSLIIACADATAIPAGGALAVDRESFSCLVTRFIQEEPLIELISRRIDFLPADGLVIAATGPLTDGLLFQDINRQLELETLHFFDAAAPIVWADSLDNTVVFRQSRYGHGGDDYLNCPMNETEYQCFWQELVNAEKAAVHDFDRETVFEGCMPIETMAGRGQDTMRFGPLKPVGLTDPRTGKEPYACVQLRQDNRAASLYNLVGFQTRLTIAEQKRVFRLIPGLQQAEFARFGVMHRNTYLQSPQVLQPDYSARCRPELYFAGQMTGVEGYVESASSGLIAGWQAACQALGQTPEQRMNQVPSDQTVIGSLARYVSDAKVKHFQPMNANFGLVADLAERYRRKELKLQALADRSLAEIDRLAQTSPDITAIRLQLFHKADRIDLSQIP
ncbi:MAG: methylenetetrahydrofolate--tRNA-(uracil(54)-C(5))-methyltransferase (FADH(2)-oxidizing) TrmFO [Clostridiaceae bacterium]|nr:methylenetetrahydrofolate--tRNA-(uracil(54)-C(5))-methyltransferase (FADH(2)-oxidizing) TrmFO [Clostridiaceae bacterium]